MNAYIADQIARQHADALMADAAAARRSRQARKARRAAGSTSTKAAPTRPQRVARPGAATAHFVARPFSAFSTWFAAGQL